MHVSPSLAELIWQQRDQFLSGGRPRSQKLVATILFADLKGFSPVAEELDPIKLTEWLNTYMDKMTQVVMEHSGVVDDYAGDGIKADFGTPLARKTEDEIRLDAENAVRCALCMGEEMQRINTFWKEQGLPTAGLRIGVHTGLVVAGNFGSSKRLKYTTIGNCVNIASRLESYDREHADAGLTKAPFRILISEATKGYIGGQFVTRELGAVRFKGQKRDITVYSVLDWNRENSLDPMKEPKS
jgi:adenylate cyclase